GVRLPEGHLGDAVGLGGEPLGETEGLEGLDAASLDAVGLTDLQPLRAPLDDAGVHVGEAGELGGGDRPGGAGTNDEHVHLIGQPRRAVETDACRRLHSWIGRDVAVVVKLHRHSCRGYLLQVPAGCVTIVTAAYTILDIWRWS